MQLIPHIQKRYIQMSMKQKRRTATTRMAEVNVCTVEGKRIPCRVFPALACASQPPLPPAFWRCCAPWCHAGCSERLSNPPSTWHEYGDSGACKLVGLPNQHDGDVRYNQQLCSSLHSLFPSQHQHTHTVSTFSNTLMIPDKDIPSFTTTTKQSHFDA